MRTAPKHDPELAIRRKGFDFKRPEKPDHREAREVARLSATLRARGFGDALHAAAEAHHTTVEETLGRGRNPCAVRARWALWTFMSEAGLSSNEIGRLTGRDHTTILAALKGGRPT